MRRPILIAIFTLSGCAQVPPETTRSESPPEFQSVAQVAFTEGPVYHEGSVYFTDIANDRIMRFTPGGAGGAVGVVPAVFRHPAGRANGLAFDSQGRLLACEGGGPGGRRQVSRTETDGSLTAIATHFEGRRLNSPNDLALDAQGRIYFTDPRYGDRSDLEMDVEGVYRIDPDGGLFRVIDDMQRPNGIAVSLDQNTLYVVDNNSNLGGSRKVYAFELENDGSVGARRVIHDFGSGRGGDGVCLDGQGNLYVTAGLNIPAPPAEDHSVPAAVYVFAPDGRHLRTHPVPEDMVTNCSFGGPEGNTLYVTAGKTLWSLALSP